MVKIDKSVENFFSPDNKHNAPEVLEFRPFRPAFDSQHFEEAFTCYYRSSSRLLVQFIEIKMPALVYLSFKPWVNPQKFLWKEEALWLPSVDELINVFSLHQLEFVSFWLDYFPTYYEIRTFAKAPKQCWATRSPQLKHTDHIPLSESPHLNKSSLNQIWSSWFDSTISGKEKLSKSSSGDSVVAQGRL